jgi:RNA polymerase sigma-70 factor (ECF subfamily)
MHKNDPAARVLIKVSRTQERMLDRGQSQPLSLLGLSTDTGLEGSVSLQEQVKAEFLLHRDSVYRYLRALRASPATAEELAQEAFLRLFRYLRAGNQLRDPATWVLRVAHNLWRDEQRKASWRQEMSENDPPDRLAAERRDPQPGAEERLLLHEREERLAALLETLTPFEQQALHLRAEGLRYREIATVMGSNISTVASSIRRAVERLGRLYE